MGWVRINPDGSRTPVEGDPFAQTPQQSASEPELAPEVPGVGGTLWDVIRSGLSGVRRGAEEVIGLPGDVAYGMRYLNDQARQGLGLPANPAYVEGKGVFGTVGEHTSQQVHDASTKMFGESHKPKTTAGKYAKTVGEFVPGAFVGGATRAPATLPRFLLGNAAVPGLASEAAGQAAEGTGAEGIARMLGGLAGGIVGTSALTPGPLTEAQGTREALQQAARRLDVQMPEYMMPDSVGARVAAERLGNLPLVGGSVRDASEHTARQLGSSAEEMARGASSTNSTDFGRAMVGGSDALDAYVRSAMPEAIGRAYDNVDANLARPNLRNVPTNTRQAIRELLSAPSAAKRRANQRAIDVVLTDAQRTDGLTYAETKDLRSVVGAMMDDNTMPDFASANPAFKRLYGALTDDQRNAVQRAGGTPALDAWERANDITRGAKEVGRNVQRVAGATGDVMPDTIMARMRRMGQMRDPRIRNRLNQMKIAMDEADPDAWGDMSAAMIYDLGVDPKSGGAFDPAVYAREYGKLSNEGRAIFWDDPDLRRSLDDLAELSNAFVDTRNPSPWVQMGVGAGTGVLAVTNLPAALGAIGSSWVLSRLLSRPASAQKVVSFARARMGVQGQLGNAATTLAGDIARETGEDPQTIVKRLMGDGNGRGSRSRE